MKKMKKILAMLLALTMVLGMSLTSMAADSIIGNSDDEGTITVKGIADESGITVTAYQIVKASYDETNGYYDGLELVYPSVNPEISLTPNDAGEITINQANLNAIIATNKVEDTTYTMEKQANGDYTKTVPVGAYLVVVSGAEAKVYSPMVVSVNYVNSAGNNSISGGTVNTIENGNAWVKESGIPSFSKIEADAIANTNNDGDYGNSIDIGNNINYTLTINPIPYYGGDYPVLNIVDTLDAGLTYVDDSLVVKVDNKILVDGVDYKFTKADQVLTVDFVVDHDNNAETAKVYGLNDYQSQSVVITYSAKLNSDATVNDTPNVNTAVLNFTYDSKFNTDDVKDDSGEKKTYTYTFELTDKLLKTGENNVALENATFVLYTDSACTTPYVQTNGLTTNGTYTTDANGKLTIKGLEAGTYYLKETVAPTGYSVNTHVYKIEVVAEYDTDATNQIEDGSLTNWGIKVDDANEMTNMLTIPNTKLVSLPSTGGIGTTIFTVAGCGIMVAAAFFFFASRKKED